MSLRFTPSGKILPPPEVREIVEVERLRREAARMVVASGEKVSEAIRKGYDDGFRSGREAGRMEAVAELRHLVDGYRAHLQRLMPRLEPLVLQAVERILDVMPPEEITRAVLKKVLAEAADVASLRFRVSPADHAGFAALYREVARDHGAGEMMDIIADPLVAPGEIVVETPDGQFHAGHRQQIHQLREILK